MTEEEYSGNESGNCYVPSSTEMLIKFFGVPVPTRNRFSDLKNYKGNETVETQTTHLILYADKKYWIFNVVFVCELLRTLNIKKCFRIILELL